MSNPIGETSFNVASWVADTGNIPEESFNEGRRAYSLNISRSPYRFSRSIASDTSCYPISDLNNDPCTENSVPTRDPLTVLIPITDGVLVITAIIFIVALGFVAVIVVMALIKVYFLKDELDSIWTDDWFWPG